MKKLALLFGGPSSEHEVSLSSSENILEHIDRELFDVLPVLITKECQYVIDGISYNEGDGLNELVTRSIDVVFPMLHGKYGEDGSLQKKLEDLRIRFVFSSSQASALAIDKNKTNEILQSHAILIPQSSVITRMSTEHSCKYPIIVKPIDEGSSVGLFKCSNVDDYRNSLEKIFEKHHEMLVQEFIQGREFTCGIIEKDNEIVPLVATEIVLTKGETFDYDAKYTVGGCEEITPASVDEKNMRRLQNCAMRCHSLVGCKSLSRTDMILQGEDLYVLEINTIPGMTKTSFIPAEARACGYSMKELITILIESAK
jgi:D-alanine-D-alanine ligase